MRHRIAILDLVLVLAAVLVLAYVALEVDIFATEGHATAAQKTIDLDESLLIGSVLAVGLLLFAVRRYVEQKREMARRIAAEWKARELAYQDPLTGLANRRRFEEALRIAVASPPAAGSFHAVLVLDLNGFKRINDTYGHGTGDGVLIIAAQRLLGAIDTPAGTIAWDQRAFESVTVTTAGVDAISGNPSAGNRPQGAKRRIPGSDVPNAGELVRIHFGDDERAPRRRPAPRKWSPRWGGHRRNQAAKPGPRPHRNRYSACNARVEPIMTGGLKDDVLPEAGMEAAQRRGLARLQLRWPERRKELARRAESDERVGELYEAHEAAYAAMEYWLHSSAPIAAERIEEYRALISATEEDILALLSPP